MDLNRVFASDVSNYSQMSRTGTQYFHREQYRLAREALTEDYAPLVEAIVCDERLIEEVGAGAKWRTRTQAYVSGVERLRFALNNLIKLWGI